MLPGGQHDLRLLNTPVCVVAMRRNAKRLLERTAEVISAQPREPGESCERYLLGQMFVDICGYEPLLPGGKPAPNRSFRARSSAIETDQFMHQNDTQRLEIKLVVGVPRIDRLLELHRGAPDRRILEEQPRRKEYIGIARFVVSLQL